MYNKTMNMLRHVPIKRLRFSVDDDFVLLREVSAHNPYADNRRWTLVHENIVKITGKAFSLRAVKEHVEHLLKLFDKQDKANIKKNSSEQEYEERRQLLGNISAIANEYRNNKTTTKRKAVSENKFNDFVFSNFIIKEEPIDVEDHNYLDDLEVNARSNISDELETDAGTSTNSSQIQCLVADDAKKQKISDKDDEEGEGSFNKTQCVDYTAKQLEIEERKLALKEQKLELEKQKFQLEKEERGKRLQQELKEREANMRIIEQQQQFITLFMKEFFNKR